MKNSIEIKISQDDEVPSSGGNTLKSSYVTYKGRGDKTPDFVNVRMNPTGKTRDGREGEACPSMIHVTAQNSKPRY